jgi:hypothetical protein
VLPSGHSVYCTLSKETCLEIFLRLILTEVIRVGAGGRSKGNIISQANYMLVLKEVLFLASNKKEAYLSVNSSVLQLSEILQKIKAANSRTR